MPIETMPDATPLLITHGLTKTFTLPGAAPVAVLKGVDLSIVPGESVAIRGPSGSGKSTLLHILGGLDEPTAGEVIFDGVNLHRRSDRDLARIRNRDIGFVFQFHHLLPQCSVLENVLLPALAEGAVPGAEERARSLLTRVGLADRTSHLPGQISGGECQRAAVARALMNRPRLILADEPTGSLDRSAAETLGDLLVTLNREEGTALVVVTHAEDLARRMGRTLYLRDGILGNS
ncbi:MAG: ABC transporter ATP-binding protein [Planctomycetota bacterium]